MLTKEKYIEIKETTGLSDMQIARMFGLSRGAFIHRKRKWGLIEKRDDDVRSLCMSCKNARASRCAWVADFTQVWKRAEKKEIVFQSGSTKKRTWVETVMIVKECDHYISSEEDDCDGRQVKGA